MQNSTAKFTRIDEFCVEVDGLQYIQRSMKGMPKNEKKLRRSLYMKRYRRDQRKRREKLCAEGKKGSEQEKKDEPQPQPQPEQVPQQEPVQSTLENKNTE